VDFVESKKEIGPGCCRFFATAAAYPVSLSRQQETKSGYSPNGIAIASLEWRSIEPRRKYEISPPYSK
jgi:hypothetical protein